MRAILFIFILYFFYQPAFSQSVELDKVGFPNYKKLFNRHLAFSVLNTNNSLSKFYVPPRGINNFNNLKDTLHFSAVIDDSDSLVDLILQNKVNEIHFRYNNGIAYFDDGLHTIKYSVFYRKNLSNLILQKDEYSNSLRDSTIGYVYFQNHFTRFNTFTLENGSLNIGIVDKDLNGIIDKSDLIVVSEDEYFMTMPNNVTATKVKDINLLKHFDNAYIITWSDGYYLNVEHLTSKLNSKNKFDLIFDRKIPNIILNDIKNVDLQQVASKNEISIVSIWSVFTPSCVENIPLLNKYAENVIGLEESRDFQEDNQTEILFSNFKLGSDKIVKLGFNGFPNYAIIDKDLNILFRSRSLKETLSFYNEYH